MVYGTIVAYNTPAPGVPGSHFGTSTATVPGLNHTVYIAVTALVINLVVAIAATAVFGLMRLPEGADETQPGHYLAGDDGSVVERVPVTTAAANRLTQAGLPTGNVPAWRRRSRNRHGTAERTRWPPRACTA